MSFGSGISIFLTALFCCTLCAQPDSSVANVPEKNTAHTISIGYANDNFIIGNEINTWFHSKILPERDDRVTASLFLSGLFSWNDRIVSAVLYYHILTDRADNFRTDLLALHIASEQQASRVRYRIGAGFLVVGDLGGRSLQNGYHKIFGYDPVNLTYQNTIMAGGLLSCRGAYLFSLRDGMELSPFLSTMYSTSQVPSYVRSGVSYTLQSTFGDWDYTVGYNHRYVGASHYNSILGTSWYYGVLCDLNVFPNHSIVLWITKNQFGIMNDLHFGFIFGWRCGTIRSTRLRDIAFP